MKWIVCQLGARRNYLVPQLLHDQGSLSRLFTDIAGNQGWPRFLHALPESWLPTSLKRLRNRIPPKIPTQLITSFPTFGVRYQWRPGRVDAASNWNWGAKEFARHIVKHGWEEGASIYLFTGAALELQQAAQNQNRVQVLDQIMAPRRWEQAILAEERERFPGHEHAPTRVSQGSQEYCDRQEEEWKLADGILCGSQFVIDTLVECGASQSKCHLVPCASGQVFDPIERHRLSRPLRVLTVGGIGLRKGSLYVEQVAKQLHGRFEFRMVGGSEFHEAALQSMRRHLQLTGPVPRHAVVEHYSWADLFLLPSLCEGSAGVTYEALSAGLPVICTHQTGSVVENGKSGYIVPMRDVDAICERLVELDEDRALLEQMSTSARERALEFDSASYGRRLIESLQAIDGNRRSGHGIL